MDILTILKALAGGTLLFAVHVLLFVALLALLRTGRRLSNRLITWLGLGSAEKEQRRNQLDDLFNRGIEFLLCVLYGGLGVYLLGESIYHYSTLDAFVFQASASVLFALGGGLWGPRTLGRLREQWREYRTARKKTSDDL